MQATPEGYTDAKRVLPEISRDMRMANFPSIPQRERKIDSHPILAIMQHVGGVEIGICDCVYIDGEKCVRGSAYPGKTWSYQTVCKFSELRHVPEILASYIEMIEAISAAQPKAEAYASHRREFLPLPDAPLKTKQLALF